MEIKLSVRAEIIAVLKMFAADNDVRYYLNGINLEIGAAESRLVACDGHRIGCFRVRSEQPEVSTPLGNIIIPKDLLKPIKAKGRVEITIGAKEAHKNENGDWVEAETFVRPVTLTYAGVSISGKTLDGKFIDYRRVIPAEVSGEPAQFNARYINDLAQAYTILHGRKGLPRVGIGFNGAHGALIDLGDADFLGVLMPLAVAMPRTPPDWWADNLCLATDSAVDLV